MIRVDTDVGDDWAAVASWPVIAERAVLAAIASSRHRDLGDRPDEVEVSVKLTHDDEVRSLNRSYRGKDRATNVLSFPMADPARIGGAALLGDVVLAYGVCAREAEAAGVGIEAHASHLIVHGTLHLLGYDHETGDADAAAMEEIERAALAAIGVADPYPISEAQL